MRWVGGGGVMMMGVFGMGRSGRRAGFGIILRTVTTGPKWYVISKDGIGIGSVSYRKSVDK